MPSFESPALYIDFSRLPPPKVIEEIDYEDLLQVRRTRAVQLNPALAKAVALEQSPTNIILEADTYAETIARARVNAAAQAVMLAFSTGSDLDNLGALLGVIRAQIPQGEGKAPIPESDERFRNRIRLSIETFSTAGSPGSYIFHAMSVDPTIRDVAAISEQPGKVKVVLMNSGADPVATQSQIDAVFAKLHQKNIKPLTDVVSVVPVERVDIALNADVRLYPGPDASLVMNDINKALTALRDRISIIGRDLTRSALMAALNQEGVQGVTVNSPLDDVVIAPHQCAWITSATINVSSIRTE